jgi:pSer/pThr/pTyr-binding forkhead associated (FHA) protein/uncharacterized RDD family membrane protein YckC
MAKLLVQESSGVREFELVDNEIKVGRELDNMLRLADPSISRHHAMVRKTATGYEIQDLGSSNGILLNGVKVQTSPLQDGDRVTLGQIQMTFVDPKPQGDEANPLGTVRINPEEMRKVQAGAPVPEPAPAPILLAPVPPAPMAPPPIQPRVPPPIQPPDAQATAPRREPSMGVPPAPAIPSADAGENPAPAFLQSWLPPIPDDALPIMIGDVPERGDFVTRLLAHLIDIAPIIAISIIFMILGFIVARIPGLNVVLGCVFSIIQLVLNLGYALFFLPWCWSKFGATPGKKMMKLRVVPEDDPNGRIPLGTAYLRLLGHICNCGIGYLLIVMPERKAVQDYISKSICIKVDR